MSDSPTKDRQAGADSEVKIVLCADVIAAGVAYCVASGLIHWNEPEPVASLFVEELVSALAAASEAGREARTAKSF